MTRSGMNRIGMNCPHCDGWATVRSSEQLSPLVRVAYFQCRNLHCGHTWKAHIEAVSTISPSAIPRADINLPVSPYTETLRNAAQAGADPRQLSLEDHIHDHTNA